MLRRMGRQYTIEHYLRAARPHPRRGARHRALDRRHRRVLRRDRRRVRGDAAAAGRRALRPGLRRRVQRAAGHAGDPPRGRRARRPRSAAGSSSSSSARSASASSATGRGSGGRPRSSSTRSCRRSTTTTRTSGRGRRRAGARPSRATRSRTCPAGLVHLAGRSRENKLVHLAGAARPRRPARATSRSTTPGRTRSGGRPPDARAAARHRRADRDRQDRARDPDRGAAARRRDPRRGRLGRLAPGLPGPRHRHGQGDARRSAARVVHHGLDLVDPDEPFSVAGFRAHALAVLADLGARGGIGILAGGTGFWLRAVMTGLDTDALAFDPAVRAGLEDDLARDGLRALAGRLRTAAPSLAARTDLHNPRRVVRALEIAALRGDAPPPAPLGYPAPARRDPARRRSAGARAAGRAPCSRAVRGRPGRRGAGAPRALGPVPAGVLGDRLPRELGVPRRRPHARGGDRARRPAQRRLREAPAHVVPARAHPRGRRRDGGRSTPRRDVDSRGAALAALGG